MSARPAVLLIGEGLALAHASRPLVLAQALPADRYDVHLACDPQYQAVLRVPPSIRFWPLRAGGKAHFTRRADRAGFVWRAADLDAYVRDERALYDRLSPALVVSDFRFSVAISAALAGIPHVAVTNAHWSPYRRLPFDPTPPWPRAVRWRQRLTAALLPWRRGATAEMNRLRARYGLPPLRNFLDMSTRADVTAYADPPGLVPLADAPASHQWLGPVLWSPPVAPPPWWLTWPRDRPLVYVTLGSTGAAARLPALLRGLRALPVTVAVATAGRIALDRLPAGVLAADYLPGEELCGHAAVVVCSGGSATAYQALSRGVPVVGLWSNLDQYLTMMAVEHAGAGLCRPAAGADATALVTRVLEEPRFRTAAAALRTDMLAADAGSRFRSIVAGLVGP